MHKCCFYIRKLYSRITRLKSRWRKKTLRETFRCKQFQVTREGVPLGVHVHDTRASLARTVLNVTILWGSWHWAVSGPIGPNLPVFHWSESRLDSARITRWEPHARMENIFRRMSVLRLILLRRPMINGKRGWARVLDNFLFFLLFMAPWKRKKRARENIRKTWNERAKNGNLWTRVSERCPPSWSHLTTGVVDQRNFAITLLPSPFLPI